MNLSPHLPWLLVAATIIAILGFVYWKKHQQTFTPYAGPRPQSNEKAVSKSLSQYGDSISVPSRLGELMPYIWFKNWAVAGTCLTDLLNPIVVNNVELVRPLEQQIPDDSASVLLMRYGRNDAAFSRSLPVFKAMLLGFVQLSREMGKVPVLCSLTNENFTDKKAKQRWLAYNNTILEIAGTTGTHFIDLSVVPYASYELPDNVHPDAAYNARLDTAIVKYFEDYKIFPA